MACHAERPESGNQGPQSPAEVAHGWLVAIPAESIPTAPLPSLRHALAIGDTFYPNAWAAAARQRLDSAWRAEHPTVGLTRTVIGQLFPTVVFSARTLADGRQAYSGQEPGGLTMVELLGPEAAPNKVTLISGVASDAPATARAALRNGLRLIDAVSGKTSVCHDWYKGVVETIGIEKVGMQCGPVFVTVEMNRIGMLVTSVTAR
jgi:hypothetical protein